MQHNKSVPTWIGDKNAAVEWFKSIQTRFFRIGSSTDGMKKLRVGSLLHTLLAHWRFVGALNLTAYVNEANVNACAQNLKVYNVGKLFIKCITLPTVKTHTVFKLWKILYFGNRYSVYLTFYRETYLSLYLNPAVQPECRGF